MNELQRDEEREPAEDPHAVGAEKRGQGYVVEEGGRKWPRVIPLTCLLLSILLAGTAIYKGKEELNLMSAIYGNYDAVKSGYSEMHERGERTEKQILISGDTRKQSAAERWKATHMLRPEDPAFFIPYFNAYLAEKGSVSDELRAFIQKYDAENAYYLLAELSDGFGSYDEEATIIRRKEREGEFKRDKTKLDVPQDYEILDEEAFREKIRQIKEAYAIGKINHYAQERWSARKEALAPPNTYLEGMKNTSLMVAPSASVTYLLRVAEIMVYAVLEAEKQKDWEEYAELWKVGNWFVESQLDQSTNLVEVLVARACLACHLSVYKFTYNDCPNQALQAQIREQVRAIETYLSVINKKGREDFKDFDSMFSLHGDFLTILSAPAVGKILKEPLSLTVEDFRAGTRSTHAWFERSFLIPLVGLFLFFLVLGFSIKGLLARTEEKKQALHLARQNPLLHYGWIIPLGCGLPIFCFCLVRFVIPYSAWDYGYGEALQFGVPHIFNVYLFFVFACLWTPVLATSVFSSCGPPSRRLSVLVVFSYLGMFTAPLALPLEGWKVMIFFNQALLVGTLLLSLWHWFSRKRDQTKKVPRHIIALWITPCYLITLFFLTYLSLLLLKVEQEWLPGHMILELTDDGSTAFETRATKQAVQELKEITKFTGQE